MVNPFFKKLFSLVLLFLLVGIIFLSPLYFPPRHDIEQSTVSIPSESNYLIVSNLVKPGQVIMMTISSDGLFDLNLTQMVGSQEVVLASFLEFHSLGQVGVEVKDSGPVVFTLHAHSFIICNIDITNTSFSHFSLKIYYFTLFVLLVAITLVKLISLRKAGKIRLY